MNLFTQHHVCNFGTQTTKTEASVGPLMRPAIEVSLVLEGELTAHADGQTTKSLAGYAMLMFCNRSIEWHLARNTRTLWCHIKSDHLSGPDHAWLSGIAAVCRPSSLLRLLLKHGLSLGSVEHASTERQLRDSLGMATFNEYFRVASANSIDVSLPASLRRAKLYMENRYAESCELRQVAAAAHLAPRYLIELFKRHLGSTPIRYLWKCRADAGIHLLRTTDLSVETIAHRSGFQTSPHFCRYLKIHHGYSPTALRRNYLTRE